MKLKIFLALIAAFVIAQFFGIDKTNPVVFEEQDFITINSPSADVAHMLKTACYDCHSNESKYPWYSSIAPISWWVKDHINEGREELNFSEWGTFSEKRKAKKIEEVIEEVDEQEMPLPPYLITHSDAKLTDVQRTEFVDFFKSLK